MVKKLTAAFTITAAALVSLMAAPPIAAAPTANITITVTISSLSISVSDGTIAFGTVNPGSSTLGTEKQVVQNNGNVAETVTLQLTSAGLLTVGETKTAAGANTFVLQALFTNSLAAAPTAPDFGSDAAADDDVIKASVAKAASATGYAWTGSTATGASVPAGGARDLYLKYTAPTSDTVTNGVSQSLTLTVAASAL